MCVRSQPAVDILFPTCYFFALQWLSIFILLGTSAQQTFGHCQPFPNSPTCLVFRPDGFFTFSFFGTAKRRSWNRFRTRRGGFCTPRISGAFTASTNAVPVPSVGTAQEIGLLTSSPPSRGQSSGGALWRAVYAPGDDQTSPAYFSQSAQCLYINHLLSVNKLVLSYLLLRLTSSEFCQILRHFCTDNFARKYFAKFRLKVLRKFREISRNISDEISRNIFFISY